MIDKTFLPAASRETLVRQKKKKKKKKYQTNRKAIRELISTIFRKASDGGPDRRYRPSTLFTVPSSKQCTRSCKSRTYKLNVTCLLVLGPSMPDRRLVGENSYTLHFHQCIFLARFAVINIRRFHMLLVALQNWSTRTSQGLPHSRLG